MMEMAIIICCEMLKYEIFPNVKQVSKVTWQKVASPLHTCHHSLR